MLGRDRFPIRPGTGSAPERPSRPQAAPNKAAGLVHRLRDSRPALRLVRDDTPPVPEPQPQPPAAPALPGRSISDPADPRWVLALRTAESLQGAILGPEKRDRLVKLGKVMGLTSFDANLVIAIVQDQARRGYAPADCPTAGEGQLALVPLPRPERSDVEARTRRITIICSVISMLVAIEVVVLKWIFS